jgi:hypothetical protein
MSPKPTLTMAIQPETRVLLEAMSTLLQQPVWQVVERGLRSLLKSLPEQDRKVIDGLTKRAVQNVIKAPAVSGTLAELIRKHAIQKLVEPAREKGMTQIKIRAGDVHTALGFTNRLPAVTAALGAERFERAARVVRLGISGPANGANTTFTFQLL